MVTHHARLAEEFGAGVERKVAIEESHGEDGLGASPLRREDWPDWWKRVDRLDAIYCGDPSPKPNTTFHGRWIWADPDAGRAYLLAFR